MRLWKRNWMIAAATVVHFIWGVVLLVSPAPLHTTPLGLVHKMPSLKGHYQIIGVVYIACSIVAVLPLFRREWEDKFAGLLCCIPQQLFLMISFATAAVCVAIGQYPDGYVPDKHGDPRLFIFADQLWPCVGMVTHTLSLLDWFWWSKVHHE